MSAANNELAATRTTSTRTTSRRRGQRSQPRLRRRRWNTRRAVTWTWLCVACLVIVFPVYLGVLGAFQTPAAQAHGDLLPSNLTLANMRTALNTIPLGHQYLVTVTVALVQAVAEIAVAALACYALVFCRWRGKRLIFTFIVVTLAVPQESLVIPNYTLVSNLGLRDSIIGIVLPFLAAGYPVFLLRQAFRAVPIEVWEAARLDGCSHLRALLQIVMPVSRGFVIAAAMWAALAAWNGYFWPLLITDTPSKRTIQVGLAQLVSSEQTTPTVTFAGLLLVSLPTLLLVACCQRWLIRGVAVRR